MYINEHSDVKTKKIGSGTKIWQFVVVLAGASIGKFCNICAHCFIEDDVIIGNNVTIKCGVSIWDGMRVADNVFIGPNVSFCNDRYPISGNKNFNMESVVIEKGASIGAGATVLPGVRIGVDSIVGAGALVVTDVPDRHIAVGNPAKSKPRD